MQSAENKCSTGPLVCTVALPHGKAMARVVMPVDAPPAVSLTLTLDRATGTSVIAHALNADEAELLGQALCDFARALREDGAQRQHSQRQLAEFLTIRAQAEALGLRVIVGGQAQERT